MNSPANVDLEFVRFLSESANLPLELVHTFHLGCLDTDFDLEESGSWGDRGLGGTLAGIKTEMIDPGGFKEGVELLTRESLKWIESITEPDSDATFDEEAPPLHDREFMGSTLEDDRFAALLEDAFAISDRFVPEPRFGREGTGFMRSAGVAEMAEAKKSS